MKKATYKTAEGPIEVEYDPEAPCIWCGLPVFEASVGGTALCPWCDTGQDRQGQPVKLFPRQATEQERKDGKSPTVFAPRVATWAEYEREIDRLRSAGMLSAPTEVD